MVLLLVLGNGCPIVLRQITQEQCIPLGIWHREMGRVQGVNFRQLCVGPSFLDAFNHGHSTSRPMSTQDCHRALHESLKLIIVKVLIVTGDRTSIGTASSTKLLSDGIDTCATVCEFTVIPLDGWR